MNFYEQQDRAKGLSSYLLFLFGFAVICIVICLFCLASIIVTFDEDLGDLAWTIELAIVSSLISILIISIASLLRVGWLSQGGKVIAESMGGHRLNPNTSNPVSRKILNVVEEMAIASGTPVPPVYLLEEEGINAFAAGYSPRDAVIGVTEGCATKLTREQLQGVMAHEFSHILNGDMRINIRLTGVIYGIIFLSIIGRMLMNVSYFSGGHRTSRKSDGGGALIVLGLGLFIIGGIGAFFGSMIRASVSRQREFLADASAVQFTRNPNGIAGALKRIGGYSEGSKIRSSGAQEFSHMFFSSGISSLFATHPPLPVRILRIEPNWKKQYPETDKFDETPTLGNHSAQVSGFSTSAETSRLADASNDSTLEKTEKSTLAHDLISNDQEINNEKIQNARNLIESIPAELIFLAKEPYSARGILFAMLLDLENQKILNRQIQLIKEYSKDGTEIETEQNRIAISKLNPVQKFILVEETRPAIAELSEQQFKNFQTIILQLIKADENIDLFEWCLHKIIEFDFGKKHYPRQLHGRASIESRISESVIILGALAHYGQEGKDPVPAFEAGIKAIDRRSGIKLPDINKCGLSAIDQALERLNKMSASAKRSLLDACARTIDHDGKTTDIEIQILRGIACALSCPIGPAI